ncbi:MAG: hypothetical protein AABX84_01490, partial [Nanoarchaeota archaeon]
MERKRQRTFEELREEKIRKTKKRKRHPIRSGLKAARTLALTGLAGLLVSPQNYDMPAIQGYDNFISRTQEYFEETKSLPENSNDEITYHVPNKDFPFPAMIPQIPLVEQREFKQDLRNAIETIGNAAANYANKLKGYNVREHLSNAFSRLGSIENVVLNEKKSL